MYFTAKNCSHYLLVDICTLVIKATISSSHNEPVINIRSFLIMVFKFISK